MRRLGLFIAVAVAAPVVLAAAAPAEGEDRNRKQRVCRDVQHTGTRIRPPRVCMTREQWELAEDLSQQDMTDWKNRPNPIDRSGIPR